MEVIQEDEFQVCVIGVRNMGHQSKVIEFLQEHFTSIIINHLLLNMNVYLEKSKPRKSYKNTLPRSDSLCRILDLPDEILGEIFLHLNARERLALAKTSKRFYCLVFKDKRLLRDLDFSKEGRLTTASDIQQYFDNENVNKYILKVNLRNVKCFELGQMLIDSIGKAANLVEINMHGIEFKNLALLACFLTPLLHIKRLSVNWPNQKPLDSEASEDEENDSKVLHEPLSRLTYLSVQTDSWYCIVNFVCCIESCQKLKHLRIFQGDDDDDVNDMAGFVPELSSLEILEIYGNDNNLVQGLRLELVHLMSHFEKLTEFQVPEALIDNCYYIEKDVEVCEEIVENEGMDEDAITDNIEPGFTLNPERLLKAVIRITHEKLPEKCCLSKFDGETRCALKIDDAKLLLRNPRHQIRYLYLSQSIGTECDVHSLALASPSLTELYLSDVMKIKKSTAEKTDSQKRSHLDKSLVDSSFEMLVKSTPLLQDLTLNGGQGVFNDDEDWDLDALFLIHGWQNLKSLCLLSLPIHDGKFLIEIGKQCKYLEKLEFYDLGSIDACCYTKDLLLMLTHCKNLTDFSMHASNIGLVSDIFFSLANNLQLGRVRLTCLGKMNNTTDLLSSVEQLLCRCSELTTFVCTIDGISRTLSDQLTSLSQRLRTEVNRPTLQNFRVMSTIDAVCEDSSPPTFPYTFEQFNFTRLKSECRRPHVRWR